MRTPKISFITTTSVNVGDEFIREGICSFIDEIFVNWSPYYINKHDLTTLYKTVYDEPSLLNDKIIDSDIVIQAGAPVYWKLGDSTSYNVEWAEELWFNRIFCLGPDKPILNIAAGACQPCPDFAKTFLADPSCIDFAQKAAKACRWTSVRDPLASQILYSLNIKHDVLPCAAFHAARRFKEALEPNGTVGINLMPLGGHFKLRDDVRPEVWEKNIEEFLASIRKRHQVTFIAHDENEKNYMARFRCADESIFLSPDYRDYFKVYGSCSVVFANRVHGAVCAAGFGKPAIIVGNDSRLQIGDFIGLPSRYVGSITADEMIDLVESAVTGQSHERERLLTLREESAKRYREAIAASIPEFTGRGRVNSKSNERSEALALASIKEVTSKEFTDFMTTLNCFAGRYGFSQYKLSGENWAYPWLWFKVLTGEMDWKEQSVLCLNCKLSPMPWFLASLGANITLVECDAQWIPTWERLKTETGLAVHWQIVSGELLPFADRSFDLVTSFSVIEHQKDKRLAVNEVARILQPGGTFTLSFDICEPDRGMTFPDWNGRALTMAEFEAVVWSNPEFMVSGKPQWNIDVLKDFVAWHKQSAEHHTYAAGAAVLRKRLFNESSIKKILIPRFDTHGDIVLLEGFIHALLDRFPQAEITLFVRDGYDQLALLFPYRLKWRTQPYNPWARYSDDDLQGISGVLDAIATVQWDLVLFTTYNRTFLEDLLAAKLNSCVKIGLGRQVSQVRWQERFLELLGLSSISYDVIVPAEELSHETEKYQKFWEDIFGYGCQLPLPSLAVPDESLKQADSLLADIGLHSSGYVACVPAGVQNVKIKKWPEERYAEILAWLAKEHGVKPLLVGQESERYILEKTALLLEQRGVAASLWFGKNGELSILAALMKQAKFYLGNDTGPMHMAAALGIPTVGVFGGGTWPRFLPKGSQAVAVSCKMPCYYCMWNCIFEDAPCMNLVEVSDLKDAIGKLLNGRLLEGKNIHPVEQRNKIGDEHIGKAKKRYERLCAEMERRQEVIDSLTYAQDKVNSYGGIQMISSIRNSLSWRLTKPLRWLGDRLRR